MTTRKATKRTASKKTPGRKTARKATAKRKASAKGKPIRSKKTAARAKTPTPDLIARKIVRMTKDHSKLKIEDLYAENCVSHEPNQDEPALGHEGRLAKDEYWESFQDSAKADWNAQNIWIKGNTICIEWDAKLVARDGRSLRLKEVAIHEVKGGKIVSERFYFDSAALQPAAQPAAPVPTPAPTREPELRREPESRPEPSYRSYSSPSPTSSYSSASRETDEDDDEPLTPKVDPIDL